ncbi:MAG: ArsR family transcriptional regulator [Chloroflexaceae bacterium]|nr:ArsR family transcriptional regulator [Chloroflexaceae bacterium]
MFEDKADKKSRMEAIVNELECNPKNQSQLARRLGVSPSTIEADLIKLEKQGVLIQQDQYGFLSIFRRRT